MIASAFGASLVLFSPAYALKCKGPEGCCGGGEAFLEKKSEFNTATAVTTPELVDLERQINKVDFTYPDGRADKTVMAKTDELSNSVNALIDFTRNIAKVLQQFDLAFKSHENQHGRRCQGPCTVCQGRNFFHLEDVCSYWVGQEELWLESQRAALGGGAYEYRTKSR